MIILVIICFLLIILSLFLTAYYLKKDKEMYKNIKDISDYIRYIKDEIEKTNEN